MRLLYLFFSCFIFTISCTTTSETSSSLTKYIPKKAAIVLKINDFKDLQSEVKNNDFLQALSGTEAFTFINDRQELFKKVFYNGEVLICYTRLGRDDYDVSIITEVHPKIFEKDSLLSKEISKKPEIINSLGTAAHYMVKDQVFIASTSKLLLENIVRDTQEGAPEDTLFQKAYASANDGATASIFIRGSEVSTLFSSLFPNERTSPLKDSFTWTTADVDLYTNDLRLNGVTLVKDSTNLKLSLFKNTEPTVNAIAKITPHVSTGVEAITYTDWEQFKTNKADLLQLDPLRYTVAQEDLFSTFTEVGKIKLSKGIVGVGVSSDITASNDALAGASEEGRFREQMLYRMVDSTAFAKAFTPLLNFPTFKYYTSIDTYYLFAENKEQLETVIANYQNKATLALNSSYQNTERQLSSASSYLTITNLGSGGYRDLISEQGRKNLATDALEGYDYSALQLIQENDYLLFNMVVLKNESKQADASIAQIANVKLNAPIVMRPQFVKNHRTNGQDIVVQDANNTLYLISNTGKVLWQKDLDGPILGTMEQIDLYRNGRLQLAFTTPSSFYVLDRNGNEVAPYPLSFKDRITQPLAIFDYDRNSNYRFVIVQNDKVLMYDKKAKPVNGFTFREAANPILFPPAHIRIANKDYIAILESDGTTNILSRTGKARIEVSKKINFGDLPLFKSGNNFETFTVNGEKVTITTSGKFVQSISDFDSDSKIAVKNKLKVGQRENTLIINGKKIEIPLGTYTQPTIATVGKTSYVGLTNTETNEVYMYDAKGKLLPNFPIYGTSQIDINYLESNKSLGFVTQGSLNSILIYKIN